MKIINTSTAQLSTLSPLHQLALYSGMDNLTLYEINDGLDEAMTPGKFETYKFEMELQAALLEMSFNGIYVDTGKRQELIKECEAELARVQSHLHSLCKAIGYYDYYISKAVLCFSWATGIPESSLPRSWEDWKLMPLAWRREVKKGNEEALADYQKALKQYAEPFNGNSPAQKLQLFYDFFGIAENENADPDFPPPWIKTRGIQEIKTRNVKGEFTPAADRECLEKIQSRGKDFDPRDAHYWALPFIKCCLSIADLSKSLGFLRCRLEKGYFRASFGAVTETGRLNSKENAQGYGSNAQNITPKLRSILAAEPGYKLATPDYEQIESRIVGAICYRLFGATAYLDACECGDLHTLVASLVWDDLGWPEEFTLDYLRKYGTPFPHEVIQAAKQIAKKPFYRHFSKRDAVKRLGHGSNYRGQPRHMAKQTHIPFELVEHFQETYFMIFPELIKWHRWVAEQLQVHGVITTIFGRTRRFFGRPYEDGTIREAIAHEPQSTAADYTNRALLRLFKATLYEDLPIKIFLQKHDEIGFKYKEHLEDLTVPKACAIMQESVELVSPTGERRQWSVPVEPMVGWNLGKESDSNPDGLIVYTGHDARTRQNDPSNFLKWKL